MSALLILIPAALFLGLVGWPPSCGRSSAVSSMTWTGPRIASCAMTTCPADNAGTTAKRKRNRDRTGQGGADRGVPLAPRAQDRGRVLTE